MRRKTSNAMSQRALADYTQVELLNNLVHPRSPVVVLEEPLHRRHIERHQDLGGGCAYGGGWGFNISAPGTYTYLLDVEDRDGSGSVHGEQQFVVDP